jgi:hypothetical protein|tara:strand:+ start:519 stop:707 length:189 start_codon:yes stop_codon:yes gene_type:complete
MRASSLSKCLSVCGGILGEFLVEIHQNNGGDDDDGGRGGGREFDVEEEEKDKDKEDVRFLEI